MPKFSSTATVSVEAYPDGVGNEPVTGELSVDISGESWRDFKGFYGSKPAYEDECEWDVDEIRWNGEPTSRADLVLLLGQAETNEYLEIAFSKALEQA